MINFLCRIEKICKEYPKIRENLIRHNVISYLLDFLMSSTNVGLQSTIINLLSVLFRYRANRVELRKFFNFFVQNDHLVPQFVDGLLVLISGSTEKIAPTFFLNFPQLSLPEDRYQNNVLDEWVSSVQRLQNEYIPTPWDHSCLNLSSFQNQPTCIWSTGFSVSFWLKYNALSDHVLPKLSKNSSSENQMHILSVGTDTMLLELWVEETKCCFGLRLTLIGDNNFEVHSKFIISAPISSSRWHLMAICVSSEMKNENINFAMKVIIDGMHEEIFQTNFKKLPKSRRNDKMRVIIGDYLSYPSEFQSSYCLGNLMMFQSDILTKVHCLTIRSYGPDFENFLAPSTNGMKVNLTSSIFVPHDIDDSVFLQVLQNHEKYVEHLREKIILSFTPRESQYFYRYLFHVDSLVSKNIHSFGTQSFECQTTDQHFLYNIKSSILHPILPQRVHTFYDYILDNGGFSFVSFLLAKVVELSECPFVHANILRFVLKISSSDCYLHSQLEMHRGYDLISYVMANARFIFSEHSLIVLLEATCNEKLFRSDDICTLRFPKQVRIYNAHIISALILPHWRRWQECNPSLLIVFFKNLCKFIHPRNNHQTFNAELLTSQAIVEKILNFCQEKFLEGSLLTGVEENDGDVNRKLIAAVLDFMQSMVCLLHSVDHFRLITDFLLVMYPSSALRYQPSEGGYFWSFETSSIEKLQKRFQSQDKVDDIVAELCITHEINSDTCWNGDAPTLSLSCEDKMDVLLNCNSKECTACKGEGNFECIHNLNCKGSSRKTFCQQCQVTFCDSILGQNSVPSGPLNDSFFAVGLLSILHNTVMVLPDTILKTILRDIVNGDLLITLINHPHASVRAAVLKLVNACMSRVPNPETDIFNMHKGFYILADQLTLYPVSEELVNNCVSMICRHGFTSRKEFSLCLTASPPLLALLPKSVPHFLIAINILRYVKLMVKRNRHALEILTQNGLIDNLLKTIQITIHASICESCREECMKPLVAESMDLFNVIVNTCLLHLNLSTSKEILREVFFKWHWLIVIENFEWRTDGKYLRIMNNLRRRVLQTALDKTLSMIKYHCSNNKETVTVLANDLMSRFEFVINRSLEFILFPPFVVPLDKTFRFVCKLFVVLIDAVSDMVAKTDSIYQQVNVFLRKQMVHFLLWVLTPSKPTYMRMFAVRKLHFEPNLKKIIVTLFHDDVESEYKLAVFLWQLTFSNSHKLSHSELSLCENFIQRIRRLRVLSIGVQEKTEKRWCFQVRTNIREMTMAFWDQQKLYFDTLAAFIKNYSNEMQTLSKVKQENGFVLSGNIVERLDAQNRKHLYDANVKNCIRVEIKMIWTKIIEQLTHERSSWFVRLRPCNFWTHESVPLSNGADKLSKCEGNAGKKFLIQKCLQQMDNSYEKRLSYLFDENEPNASVLSYIFMKDVISTTFNVIKIQYGTEIDGEILIGEKNLYFIPARDIHLIDYNSDFSIPFNSIDEIFYRTYKLKDNCVEMFLSNGKAEFFNFFSQEKRNEFLGILKNCISSKRIICCCILDIFTQKWKNSLITNWEYIHILNKLAGKSYNDIMQYPLMPLILADYKSRTIDLAQPNIYRNLKNLSSVRAVDKEFKTGSHNHNAFNLSTFSLNLFSGSENNDAVISEYFDACEILRNIYTPKKTNRTVIKNIKLPRWAHNNHRLFALVYRQLLESQYVRKNLPHWIDLTFGFKQATDFVKKQVSPDNCVRTSCQMKNPLFTAPHPLSIDKKEEGGHTIPVISDVRSINWGNFAGSPSKDPPSIVSRRYFSLPVVAFVPLMTNSVHVVFSKTAPLFFYDYEQVLETGQKDHIKVSHQFLLYWNSNNGIISIKDNSVQRPLAFCSPRDPITVCSTTPDYCNVWVGLSSGTIFVFKLVFDSSSILTDMRENPSLLLGHSNKINAICLSRPFGIAVSVSEDKSAIFWNLNKMTYMRSITGIEFPLNTIAISDTLGDVAMVGYDELNSRSSLRMYTIDGVLLGTVDCAERITAICFSTAPEGISVNVIVTAFQNGVIRLWNTWDLSAVAEFSAMSPSPVTSLTYSSDAENLYAATEDGYVTVWRSSERTTTKNSCCQR